MCSSQAVWTDPRSTSLKGEVLGRLADIEANSCRSCTTWSTTWRGAWWCCSLWLRSECFLATSTCAYMVLNLFSTGEYQIETTNIKILKSMDTNSLFIVDDDHRVGTFFWRIWSRSGVLVKAIIDSLAGRVEQVRMMWLMVMTLLLQENLVEVLIKVFL